MKMSANLTRSFLVEMPENSTVRIMTSRMLGMKSELLDPFFHRLQKARHPDTWSP